MRMPPAEPSPASPEVDLARAQLAAAAIAPRPYSAEQIRQAMPVGFATRYLVQVPGRAAVVSVTRVLAATPTGATLWQGQETPLGEALGAPSVSDETWIGLRDHATFVATETRLQPGALVTTPAGTFRCTLFTVRAYAEGRMVESRFHFADDKPGAPVRYERLENDETTYLLTLLSYGLDADAYADTGTAADAGEQVSSQPRERPPSGG